MHIQARLQTISGVTIADEADEVAEHSTCSESRRLRRLRLRRRRTVIRKYRCRITVRRTRVWERTNLTEIIRNKGGLQEQYQMVMLLGVLPYFQIYPQPYLVSSAPSEVKVCHRRRSRGCLSPSCLHHTFYCSTRYRAQRQCTTDLVWPGIPEHGADVSL